MLGCLRSSTVRTQAPQIYEKSEYKHSCGVDVSNCRWHLTLVLMVVIVITKFYHLGCGKLVPLGIHLLGAFI